MPDDDLDAVTEALVAASRAFVAVASRSVSDLLADITLPQYRVVVVLATSGPQSLRSLADALDASPSTASRLCERLVRKKLIRRQAHRPDRREVRLSATRAGQNLYREVMARRREIIQEIVRDIPPAKRSQLVRGLSAFIEAAGRAPEQAWSVGWSRASDPEV